MLVDKLCESLSNPSAEVIHMLAEDPEDADELHGDDGAHNLDSHMMTTMRNMTNMMGTMTITMRTMTITMRTMMTTVTTMTTETMTNTTMANTQC